MSQSRKYATFVENAPQYAPYASQVGTHTRVTDALSEEEANALGFKLVIDEKPTTDPQHYAVPTGWTDGDRIVRQYEVREIETPPRRWTQLSIETTIGLAGKSVEQFHTTLKGMELWAGYTVFRAYDIADYVQEFYPNAETWETVLNGLAESLGQTRAELDAFIDTIPTEG